MVNIGNGICIHQYQYDMIKRNKDGKAMTRRLSSMIFSKEKLEKGHLSDSPSHARADALPETHICAIMGEDYIQN